MVGCGPSVRAGGHSDGGRFVERYAHQLGGFGMESPALLVAGMFFLKARNSLYIPLACIFFVTELPVGHR